MKRFYIELKIELWIEIEMNLGVLNNHILELLKYYKDKFDGINLNYKNENI
jgi:hypothetical protein